MFWGLLAFCILAYLCTGPMIGLFMSTGKHECLNDELVLAVMWPYLVFCRIKEKRVLRKLEEVRGLGEYNTKGFCRVLGLDHIEQTTDPQSGDAEFRITKGRRVELYCISHRDVSAWPNEKTIRSELTMRILTHRYTVKAR